MGKLIMQLYIYIYIYVIWLDNAIRYDDNSLDAFTSDGDGVVEDYLMEPRELDFGREKEELNEKLLKWQTINSMIWFC